MSMLECHNVSIRYITGDFKDIGLKEYVIRKLKGQYEVTEFWADKDISFSIEKGDMLGIIGSNGAGKSTLLKAVTGIMEPTEGYVVRNGNIAALLELASGFDGDLTVKENAFLRGAMLGYTRQFMNDKYQQILDFSELWEFENRPFKQLSSGMKSRLAFSIASMLQPEILILDEVLSVGDGAFRQKSEEKMREIIDGGATTILVSHSLNQVRKMCNKVLWIEKGKQIAFGDTRILCNLYQLFLDKIITLDEAKGILNSLEGHYDYMIVGGGISGVVYAHEAAKRGKKVLLVDNRRKLGGQAINFSKRNITYYWHGRHVFHTDDKEIWDYMDEFCHFRPYRHKVYAKMDNELYPVSVDMVSGQSGYADVLLDDAKKICAAKDKTERDFFSDKYQGIPEVGFSEAFKEMIDGCNLAMGISYEDVMRVHPDIADKIIFTGTIDSFFGFEHGRLEYTTMDFKDEVINVDTFQGKAEIINCDPGTGYTRTVEYKLITGGDSTSSIIVREYPVEWGPGRDHYFPVRNEKSLEMFEKYKKMADETPNVYFGGRLGTFTYMTMAEAARAAIEHSKQIFDEE